MDRKVKLLTVMLSLALLVSLTMACIPGLPDLGAPAEGEETPVSESRCGDGVCDGPENPANCPQDCAPPEGETPEPTPAPEELPFDVNVEALNDLDSYAYTFYFEGLSTATGAVEHTTLDIHGQRQSRPTRAEELSFSTTDGETSTMEIIYIEEQNKMWSREGGGAWQEVPLMDAGMLQMFDVFSMGFWWNNLFAGDPATARLVGQETVNGVLTDHYTISETAAWQFAIGCTFASVQDDTWVAVDGNFPVKRQFDAAGECQGESGEVHFHMDVSNINQPVSISPPM